MNRPMFSVLAVSVLLPVAIGSLAAGSILNLGPEELVQANGAPIQVPGYSVPSFVDWNNDGLNDLIIGEGGGSVSGKVRIYLNMGTESNPRFSSYFYAQSNGSDLVCTPEGCLGCFPRVVDWDEDGRKDLLIGQAGGTVRIFLNVGNDNNPMFGGGNGVTAGLDEPINVGKRATPTFVDWNNDGMMDLVVGGLDGAAHIYLNCGCCGAVPPHFYNTPPEGWFAQENDANLYVPTGRSSPVIMDLDGDGKKDILTGNTEGQLLFYKNTGADSEPVFSGYSPVKSNGVPINLPGTLRSRPFVCYWTGQGDGYLDVLVGAGDGKVRLYRGIPKPGDFDADGDIDFADFSSFALCWHNAGTGPCSAADLNSDGQVDFRDLQTFVDVWLMSIE